MNELSDTEISGEFETGVGGDEELNNIVDLCTTAGCFNDPVFRGRCQMCIDAVLKKGKEAKLVCSICDKVFKKKAGLINHQKYCGQVNDRPYKCEKCGKTFKNKGGLGGHVKYCGKDCGEVDKPKRVYTCSLCGNSFEHKKEYAAHKLVCKEFKCKFCGEVFATTQALNGHKGGCAVKKKKRSVVVIPKSDLKKPKPKKETQKKQREKHMDYICPDCNEEFETQQGFAAHSRFCKGKKNITVDFSKYKSIYDEIINQAKREIRTPEQQIIYFIREYLENKPE